MATADQLTLPGFVTLLLLIAVHRANPKFGGAGMADASAVTKPLPGCLEALLTRNILKAKRAEKQAAVRQELKSLDVKALFASSRSELAG